MKIELTSHQKEYQAEFKAFSNSEVAPLANQLDQEERMSASLIQKMAEQTYLGAVISSEYGGLGLDMVSFGLLNEEIGRGCSSLRSLITVHSMVAQAIIRWGTATQKKPGCPN